MLEIINMYASEHLVLMLENYKDWLPNIRHAGAIFCGPYTPVALGDYYAGPNHVLPTSGTARFASALGVWDFMKQSTVLSYSQAEMQAAVSDMKLLAEKEGFTAHYQSLLNR